MTIRLALFLLLLVPVKFITVSGQRFQNIRQAEDTLSAILANINMATDDSIKYLYNKIFSRCLYNALKLTTSDSYQFDSLKNLAKLTSPDNKFRIFHWNLPTGDGKHRYFGFIKLLGKDPPVIYQLIDRSDSLLLPDTAILDNFHWFGALYYKVIPGETATGEKIYTLLGWAGRNPVISQKVIEILHFDEQERPGFGLRIFPGYHGGDMTRIIFRFSPSTSMSLKYEKQLVAIPKKWNSKTRSFDSITEESRMIVFDRLIPLDPQLKGQYQFYVGAGDISDGFIIEQNCWKFISGIDTRNKK